MNYLYDLFSYGSQQFNKDTRDGQSDSDTRYPDNPDKLNNESTNDTATDSNEASSLNNRELSTPDYSDDMPPFDSSMSPTQSLTLPNSYTNGQHKNIFGKLFKTKVKGSTTPPSVGSRRHSFDGIPQYIRIHSHRQPNKVFQRLYIQQTLCPPLAKLSALPSSLAQRAKIQASSRPTSPNSSPENHRTASYDDEDAIYDIKFSHDGKHLASANFNGVVRIHNLTKDGRSFDDYNVKQFRDHQTGVSGLDWSKNNFLITASLDKTVKLWHPDRNTALATFRHSDIVTSTKFHPKDDRYFLSASLDATVRLWLIPKKVAVFSTRLSELITACAFNKSGKYILTGGLTGQFDVFTYTNKGLDHKKTIQLYHHSHQQNSHHNDCHASRKTASSKKIVGIEVVPNEAGDYVLVTNADNRAYMIDLDSMKVVAKFKGNRNRSMQMSITPSNDGSWISSGSEDKHIYVWPINSALNKKEVTNISVSGYDLWQTPEVIKCTAILRQNHEALVVGGSDNGVIYVYRATVNNQNKAPDLKHPKPNQMSLPLPSSPSTKKSKQKRPLSALPILGRSHQSQSPLSLTPSSTISPKYDRHQYF
ncbi:WD40 repeat-like protein [Wallemia mellicola]|uniref:WD40 repeat-like protein n=1 Tax=Wallemia mellicola TaxID=1708541 RepID=A0A4T0M1N0_9BASI|nr:hypothetical protein E3Q23_02773 [Wallemia mellicola]TIB76530.1 WD40 repeat-like protein [Wallemia mellicola]TIC09360.1 WD40 repeat-like protein [Wallemia mellicola]TIC51266.1 WD40 repeat-like protein [Wallemia mellicola]TIC64036.1 WD40 repeat-like protein [Wallemia mellicola]